ncbi:MAG: hypothetical protein RMY35_008405 [Nostoc sp. DedSLP01]
MNRNQRSPKGIPGSTLFPVPEAPYNVFPYLFLSYILATCGWFLMVRLRSPNVVVKMRQGIEEIHTRFSDTRKIP